MERGPSVEGAVEEDRLVQRAQRGDAAAFTELVKRHDDQLRGLAFHLLGDRDLIDDTMQDVYLKAFRALPGFKGRASLSTWLYRLAYNLCLDELRRSGRRPRTVPLDEIVDPPAAAPDPGEALSGQAELRAALMKLPPDQRAAMWLVDAMGFDYSEAGTIMAAPTGTIASRLSRARAALRRTVASSDAESET